MKDMSACRSRVTRSDATASLAAAIKALNARAVAPP
jgi:hypothetical protein